MSFGDLATIAWARCGAPGSGGRHVIDASGVGAVQVLGDQDPVLNVPMPRTGRMRAVGTRPLSILLAGAPVRRQPDCERGRLRVGRDQALHELVGVLGRHRVGVAVDDLPFAGLAPKHRGGSERVGQRR